MSEPAGGVVYQDGRAIAVVPVGIAEQERIAIARLLTAAPDLLAAAKLAVKVIESFFNAMDMSHDDEDLNSIKVAIARASGEAAS